MKNPVCRWKPLWVLCLFYADVIGTQSGFKETEQPVNNAKREILYYGIPGEVVAVIPREYQGVTSFMVCSYRYCGASLIYGSQIINYNERSQVCRIYDDVNMDEIVINQASSDWVVYMKTDNVNQSMESVDEGFTGPASGPTVPSPTPSQSTAGSLTPVVNASAITTQPPEVAPVCPSLYGYASDGGSCFHLSTSKKSYDDAVSACISESAHLANISEGSSDLEDIKMLMQERGISDMPSINWTFHERDDSFVYLDKDMVGTGNFDYNVTTIILQFRVDPVKLTELEVDEATLVDVTTSEQKDFIRIYVDGKHNGKIAVTLNDVDLVDLPSISPASAIVTDGEWHSLIMTFNATEARLNTYIDGSLDFQALNLSALVPDEVGTDFLVLGADQNQPRGDFDRSDEFIGMISDFRLLDHIVNDTTIKLIDDKMTTFDDYTDYLNCTSIKCDMNNPALKAMGPNLNITTEEDNGYRVYEFKGTQKTSYVQVSPDITNNFNLTAFTISAWIYPVKSEWSLLADRRPAILSYHHNSFGDVLSLTLRDMQVDLEINDDHEKGGNLNYRQWHHIAATWRNSDGSFNIYIDDDVVSTGTFQVGQVVYGGGTMVIGQEQGKELKHMDREQAFYGTVRDLHIFERVLNEDKITALYEGSNTKLCGEVLGCLANGVYLTYGPGVAQKVTYRHDGFWIHSVAEDMMPDGCVGPIEMCKIVIHGNGDLQAVADNYSARYICEI